MNAEQAIAICNDRMRRSHRGWVQPLTTSQAIAIVSRINGGQSVRGITAARLATITDSNGEIQTVVRITLATGAVRVVDTIDDYTALADDPR